MRVLIDPERLLAEGKVSEEEHGRLLELSSGGIPNLLLEVVAALALLAGLAALSVITRSLAIRMIPCMGAIVAGLVLRRRGGWAWRPTANIAMAIGAHSTMLALAHGVPTRALSVWSLLILALVLCLVSVWQRSPALAVCGLYLLAIAVGHRFSFWSFRYRRSPLSIDDPMTVIALFGFATAIFHRQAQAIPEAYRRLALTAQRACFVIANVGFLAGATGGYRSELGWFHVARPVFFVFWGLGLVGLYLWARWAKHEWFLAACRVVGAAYSLALWLAIWGLSAWPILFAAFAVARGAVWVKRRMCAKVRRQREMESGGNSQVLPGGSMFPE